MRATNTFMSRKKLYGSHPSTAKRRIKRPYKTHANTKKLERKYADPQ
jgi:hypothetical protein